MIFALGRDGTLPAWFAKVHPRYRSPHIAIVTYTLIAFVLSVTGSFEQLALLSNVAVLLMYLLCFAGCWLLLQREKASGQRGGSLSFPGMKIVPILAIVAVIWILAHATMREYLVNALVLVVASLLYLARMVLRRKSTS